MQYKVIIEPDEGAFYARFPDISEAQTGGDTLEEVLANAQDALVTAFEFYFEDNRIVPLPSSEKGTHLVRVPITVWAKVLLKNRMLELRVSNAEVARRVGVSRQEINRLVDLHHPTKIDRLESALSALGQEYSLTAA